MRFIECYVENFGKLQDFKYEFSSGLNVVHGDNGYGKTTFTAFIKCMLYGMEDTKRQDLSENDRKHYMPWQGGRCGGTLTLEHGGRRYRIERSFAPKASEDSFALYDLDSGRVSEDYSSAIGEEMLGIDRDGFERTLFLSERRLSGKNDNKSISAKLSELVGCDGDIGGVDAAMKRLEEKRKYYKKTGGRGLIDELATKISICSADIAALERARESAREIENLLLGQKRELGDLEQRRQTLEAERDAMRLKRSRLTVAEQYAALGERLKRESARLEELRTAFGGNVPTADEIEGAAYKLREAEMLERSAAQAENPEYAALAARFKDKTDLSEMERGAALAGEVAEGERKLIELGERRSSRPECFSKRVPEREELLSAKADSRGAMPLVITTVIISLALAVLLIFINPLLAIAPIVIGGITALLISSSSAKRYKRVEKLLSELSEEALPKGGELGAYIDMLLAKLDSEEARAADERELEASRERLEGEIKEKREAILALLTKIGAPTEDPYREIEKQKKDYLRYYAAELTESAAVEDRRRARSTANERRREVGEFLAGFEGLGDSPFDRLREMLVEYNHLAVSTEERSAERAALKEKYGDEVEDMSFDQDKLASLEIELRDCESRIDVRRKEYAAIELRLTSEMESYERIHELKARAEALAEQKAACEDGLDTVQRTKATLTAAMEAMTSRYLGKTREGFEKYRGLIQGESRRDFLLDTSFSLSVGDVGGTHPEEAYSRGTRDIYALAMRLALSDALYEGELPPIILDDPFTALDDKALEEALTLIERIAEARQIVYITCHKSRKPE